LLGRSNGSRGLRVSYLPTRNPSTIGCHLAGAAVACNQNDNWNQNQKAWPRLRASVPQCSIKKSQAALGARFVINLDDAPYF